MKTVLIGFINSIISKIENGFDDVSTLTPDIDAIPFGMQNWIQISGPLFYGGEPHGDICVTVCLDGCNSDKLAIYQKYGYHRGQGDEGITKYYHWSERDKIANEVEDIVVTLIGVAKANTFVSNEVFTKIMLNQSNTRTNDVNMSKKQTFISICLAILILSLIAFVSWVVAGL